MYELLNSLNSGLKNKMLKFAERLVNTPSVSLNETSVARLVKEEMEMLGYDEVVCDDAGNVIGIMYGYERKQTMLLNCHMDTVSVDKEKGWQGDPYQATTKNGWLQGVGAADCKAGLAAQVYVGALLKGSHLPLKDNLVVAATVAEENGASIGVRRLIDKTLFQMDIQPTWAILGEPTSLGLYYGHDGWVEMEIKAAGANIFEVDDATQVLVNEFNNFSKQLNNEYGHEVQRIYHPVNEDVNGARNASIRMIRRLGLAEKPNPIINESEHIAMAALKPLENIAVAVQMKKEKQQLYNGTTTIVRRIAHAWEVDPFCSLITRARQSLAAAGCVARPGKWELNRLGMGTAGGVLVNEFGIPTIGYGPGEEARAHTVNEAVEVKKVTEACYGTAVIVYGLIGVPVYGWTSDEI